MEIRSIRLLLIIVNFFGIILLGFGQTNKKGFKVFDAILYKNKPNLEKYGFSPIDVVYEDGVVSTNYHEKNVHARGRRYLDYSKISKAANISRNNNIPVCLDVEHWQIQVPKEREYATSKYKELIKSYRKIDSKNKVSVFHYGSISKEIYNVSTVIYPAYYTHSANQNEWESMVRNSVSAIRKMGNKPIYAFIWPQYNNVPSKHNLGFTFIDTDVWRKQLELIYELCDGVVIWTHYNDKNGSKINFSTQSPWFQETLSFMRSKGIK